MPHPRAAHPPRRAGHVRRAAVTGCATLALTLSWLAPEGAATPSLAAAAPGLPAAVAAPHRGVPAADRLAEPGVVTDLPTGVPAPPALPAASYVLADLTSGEVLVAKGAHTRRGPASTLKLLTAQTLAPRIKGDTVIRAETSDANVDGTRVGMVPGAEYTADQLFQAMVMQSANDAAEALARTNGSRQDSLRQMNERAAQLGAVDTVAATPHGLDAPGQQTSAYDLVAILRGALATPQVAQILTMKTATFPGGGKSGPPEFQIAGQNKLLWNYDGAVGGKDGFTDAAGHTYVGAVRRGEKTYAAAFMGAPSNDWRPTAALLDWAFAHGAEARPVGALPPAVAPVASEGAGAAPAALAATGVPAAEAAEASPSADEPERLADQLARGLVRVLTVLSWAVLGLAVIAAILRLRKLRRDARRRAERRARLMTSVAPVLQHAETADASSDQRAPDEGATGSAYDVLVGAGGVSAPAEPVVRRDRYVLPTPPSSKERMGHQ